MSSDEVVVVPARWGYPLYHAHAAYVCQPGRTFRDVTHIAFYTGNEIKREVPRILARQDHVLFTRRNADRLQDSSSPVEVQLGHLVEAMIRAADIPEDTAEQVFLLTPHSDERTLILAAPIANASTGRHGQRIAWTQNQRYLLLTDLLAAPATTAGLPGSLAPRPADKPWLAR